jgi:hypothetical protein
MRIQELFGKEKPAETTMGTMRLGSFGRNFNKRLFKK